MTTFCDDRKLRRIKQTQFKHMFIHRSVFPLCLVVKFFTVPEVSFWQFYFVCEPETEEKEWILKNKKGPSKYFPFVSYLKISGKSILFFQSNSADKKFDKKWKERRNPHYYHNKVFCWTQYGNNNVLKF